MPNQPREPDERAVRAYPSLTATDPVEDDDPDSMDRVAERLRSMRRRRQFTLHALSAASGISAAMLSQIEHGRSSPSIRTLVRIARALGVPASWFFADGVSTEGDLWWVQRPAERRMMSFGEGGACTKELLSPPGDGAVQMMQFTIPPGGGTRDSVPYTHPGEDSGVVLEGSLWIEVDGRATVLHAKDTFRFSSELPHRFANNGAVNAVAIWCTSPPFW